MQTKICSQKGRRFLTHPSPVIQVGVLNPDFLAAWHLVAGHKGCIALQVPSSRVIVIVHLAAQSLGQVIAQHRCTGADKCIAQLLG